MDKKNGANGRASDGFGEVSGSIYTCDYVGFQNKVLTKGTLYAKYIYGNKFNWIILTISTKHYMSLYKWKENTTNC